MDGLVSIFGISKTRQWKEQIASKELASWFGMNMNMADKKDNNVGGQGIYGMKIKHRFCKLIKPAYDI